MMCKRPGQLYIRQSSRSARASTSLSFPPLMEMTRSAPSRSLSASSGGKVTLSRCFIGCLSKVQEGLQVTEQKPLVDSVTMSHLQSWTPVEVAAGVVLLVRGGTSGGYPAVGFEISIVVLE